MEDQVAPDKGKPLIFNLEMFRFQVRAELSNLLKEREEALVRRDSDGEQFP